MAERCESRFESLLPHPSLCALFSQPCTCLTSSSDGVQQARLENDALASPDQVVPLDRLPTHAVLVALHTKLHPGPACEWSLNKDELLSQQESITPTFSEDNFLKEPIPDLQFPINPPQGKSLSAMILPTIVLKGEPFSP